MRGWKRGSARSLAYFLESSALGLPANVYVDGFNLYFGALRGTPYKWLNLEKLARGLLHPRYDVHRIRYFTARVSNRSNRPGSPARQGAYLRALDTLATVEIEYGLFREHPRDLPLADGSGMARVLRTEEKGSDVNLATWLLLDAFNHDCELALVVSNDSDLVLPIQKVRELGLTVGISGPVSQPGRFPHRQLVDSTDFNVHITKSRRSLLRRSQFPDVLHDVDGRAIRRPAEWA